MSTGPRSGQTLWKLHGERDWSVHPKVGLSAPLCSRSFTVVFGLPGGRVTRQARRSKDAPSLPKTRPGVVLCIDSSIKNPYVTTIQVTLWRSEPEKKASPNTVMSPFAQHPQLCTVNTIASKHADHGFDPHASNINRMTKSGTCPLDQISVLKHWMLPKKIRRSRRQVTSLLFGTEIPCFHLTPWIPADSERFHPPMESTDADGGKGICPAEEEVPVEHRRQIWSGKGLPRRAGLRVRHEG